MGRPLCTIHGKNYFTKSDINIIFGIVAKRTNILVLKIEIERWWCLDNVRLLNLIHHDNFKDQFTEGEFFWFHKRKYQLKDSKGKQLSVIKA